MGLSIDLWLRDPTLHEEIEDYAYAVVFWGCEDSEPEV